MAGKDIAAAGAALTADGTADGSITVASTTPFRAKARAFIRDNNSAAVEVIIAEIVSATVMKLRFAPTTPARPDSQTINGAVYGDQGPYNYGLRGPNYGFSDMSGFTVAQSARIDMPAQFIYNEPLP